MFCCLVFAGRNSENSISTHALTLLPGSLHSFPLRRTEHDNKHVGSPAEALRDTVVHWASYWKKSFLILFPKDPGLRWESREVLRVILDGTTSSIVTGVSSRSLKSKKIPPHSGHCSFYFLNFFLILGNQLMATSYLGLHLNHLFWVSILTQHLRPFLCQ